jgi:6-phosphogluconolactonase
MARPHKISGENTKSCENHRKEFFLVGSYTERDRWIPDARGKGISFISLNTATGALCCLKEWGGIKNPSNMCMYGENLLVCSELFDEDGSLCFMRINRRKDSVIPELVETKRVLSAGKAVCHAFVDPLNGSVSFCAYLSGFLGCMLDSEQNYKTVRYEGSGPNTDRQKAPHPHQAVMHEERLFVSDLGSDKIWVHDKRSTSNGHTKSIAVPAGYGPRHLVFHPSMNIFYLACELLPRVLTYRYCFETDEWEMIEEVTSEDAEYIRKAGPAAIKIHPGGGHLLVSNRYSDGIRVFRIDGKGGLLFSQDIRLAGKCPRDFALSRDGKWLIAAMQDSHEILAYEITQKDGTVRTAPSNRLETGSPSWVIPYNDEMTGQK